MPTPAIMRNMVKIYTLGAHALSNPAVMLSTNPKSRHFLRPFQSPKVPMTKPPNSIPAKTAAANIPPLESEFNNIWSKKVASDKI